MPLVLKNSPKNIQRLLKPNETLTDQSIELRVQQCCSCGFVQIQQILENEYYDDYLMGAPHSPQMQAYQARQALDFVNRFQLAGKSVIEIGSGDGCYLGHLQSTGCDVTGIEPSNKSRAIAKAAGFAVNDGYVTAERTIAGAPFDAFVTRQVLEHVPNIHDFLTGIWRNLKVGAAGLVEVPSLEKAISDRRYYDFFPDHVNYFSKRTLRIALELNGFDVLDVKEDMFGEYNVAYVRKCEHPCLDSVSSTVKSLGEELCSYLQQCHRERRKVAIWGAGGKGLAVMASAGIKQIDLLVDSDPVKQGLITPVSHLLVEHPKLVTQKSIEVVVITAMAYKNEIIKYLREEMSYKGEIALLGHRLEKLVE